MESNSNNLFSIPKLRLALLLGILSMFYAEVYAGSSTLWMIDIWGLFITFPLYTFHSLFYLNLAQRTKKITLPQLYFWGMLFALYEAPITKVLWSGYPGSAGPSWGLVSGVAVMEFLVLVFFWHPVMSFMMPILTLEIFIQSETLKTSNIFTSHKPLLEWNKQSQSFFIAITILTSGPLAFNAITKGINPDLDYFATIILILLFKQLIPFKKADMDMRKFRFGNFGFGIIIFYMILLYTWAWVYIMPSNYVTIISNFQAIYLEGIIAIIVVAICICLMLTKSKPDPLFDVLNNSERPNPPQMPPIDPQLLPYFQPQIQPRFQPQPQTQMPPQLQQQLQPRFQPQPPIMMNNKHLYSLWGLMAILILVWTIIPSSLVILVDISLGLAIPCFGFYFLIKMTMGLFKTEKGGNFQVSK